MEILLKENKVKNIGVCNFNIAQLQEILNNCETKPIVNQIEINPYIQHDRLGEFCQRNLIAVAAYGTMGSGQKFT